MTALTSSDSKISRSGIAVWLLPMMCIAVSQDSIFTHVGLFAKWSTDIWTLLLESSSFKAFIASFCVIIFSELGDKTFFISAIMAMKNSRTTVFLSSMTANVVMNAISVLLGVITQCIPRYLISYISITFFGFFGIKMIFESYTTPSQTKNDELEEAENELKKLEKSEESKTDYKNIVSKALPFLSLVFIETFCLIFFAEWGDRSQISTILLAASEDPTGVVFGSLFGYGVCTVIAVLGGRFIAQVISIRTVTMIGGILFLAFAGVALVLGH